MVLQLDYVRYIVLTGLQSAGSRTGDGRAVPVVDIVLAKKIRQGPTELLE